MKSYFRLSMALAFFWGGGSSTQAADVFVNGDACGSLTGAGLQISTSGSDPRVDVNAAIPNSTVQCGLCDNAEQPSCSSEFALKAKDDAPTTITTANSVSIPVLSNDSYLVNAAGGVSLASVGALSDPSVGSLSYTLNSTTSATITFNPNDSVVKPGFQNSAVTFPYTIQQLGEGSTARVQLSFDIAEGAIAEPGDCQGYPELGGGVNIRATLPAGQQDIYCINKLAVNESLGVSLVNHMTSASVTGSVNWRTGVSTTPGDTAHEANDLGACYAGPRLQISMAVGATEDGTGALSYYCYVVANSVSFLTIKNVSGGDTGGYNLSTD